MKRTFLILTISLLTLCNLLASSAVHAAPAGFYFNPTSGSVTQGKTFSTQLLLGSSTSTDIKAHFSYNPSRLVITDYTTQGSPFTSTVQYDNTAGEATITGSGTGNGDRMIASFTFRAVTPGAAALTFSGTNQTGTSLLNLGLLTTSWTDAATTNANYTIISAGSTEQPTLPPATSGNSTSGSSAPRAPQAPDAAAPRAPAGNASNQGQSPRTESHQTEIEASDSRVTGVSLPAEQQMFLSTTPQGTLPLGAVIATASAILASIGMFFTYRGYRISHLQAWYQRMSALTLAKPARVVSSVVARPAIMHLASALKLITYHPIKLLTSGIDHHVAGATTKTNTTKPFAKRRTLR